MFGTDINNKGKQEKNKKVKAGPCIFPFTYKHARHLCCVPTEKGPICATSVNEHGTLETYGYCHDVERHAKKSTIKKALERSSAKRTLKKPRVAELPPIDIKEPEEESQGEEAQMTVYNAVFSKLLGQLYNLMMAKGEPFRARAYKNAQETIMGITEDITDLKQLKNKPGIGETILKKLGQYVSTGKIELLEREKDNPVIVLTSVHGIGPKKAKELVTKYKVTTLDQLRERQDELLNDVQKKGLKYYDSIIERIPRSEIDEYDKKLKSIFSRVSAPGAQIEIVGSYRRGLPNSGDIDVIMTDPENDTTLFNRFMTELSKEGVLIDQLSKGKTKSLAISRLSPDHKHRRIDFLYSTPDEYSFAILYFTGSKPFNTVMRQRALDLGYSMSEHGIHKMEKKTKGAKVVLPFPTEESIFDFLGLAFKTPVERVDGRAVKVKEGAAEAPQAPEVKVKPVPAIRKKTIKKKKEPIRQYLKTFQQKGTRFLELLPERILSKMMLDSCKLYHGQQPILTDNEYDILKEFIEGKYPNNPALTEWLSCMPTGKRSVKLPVYMGSMRKIKPDTDALDKYKEKYTGPYVLSAKLDGVSGLYTTEGGRPALYTRGNGMVGQDISHIIPYLRLPGNKDITIRGEFLIQKRVFKETYEAEFSNSRNLVAGIVNAKSAETSKYRDLNFVAYEVIKPELKPSDQMKLLERMNVEVVLHKTEADISNKMLSDLLVQWREEYCYTIDGVIVTDDKIYPRVEGRPPPQSFAFKMVLSDQVAEAKVLDVVWQASKHGYLKPRVRIEPIVLDGVTISYATGFNAAFIEQNKIGMGAVVKLIRSGDVIPHILGVIVPASAPRMPDVPYRWSETHVDAILEKPEEDPVVKEKNITNFFTSLEVEGLGAGNVRRLIAGGFDCVPKILAMSEADFLSVPGFKKKMAEKLHTGIREKVDAATLPQFMAATNIFGRGMGAKRFDVLLTEYPEVLTSAESAEEKATKVGAVKGFGKKNAAVFIENLDQFIEFLNETGLRDKILAKLAVETVTIPDHPLNGKVLVFSGFRSKDLEREIRARGGRVATGVTADTNFLVLKDSDEQTGKIMKAKELGVTIITRAQLEDELVLGDAQ